MQEQVLTIERNLREIRDKLNKNLSLSYIGFDVDYGDRKFTFSPPTTATEKRNHETVKKQFIKRVIKDALRQSLKDLFSEKDEEYSPNWAWQTIISFDEQYLTSWEDIASTEMSTEYVTEVTPEDALKGKDIDRDSAYVFAQRGDLTPEMWQEFFQNKFGKSFDLKSQDAKMTENSTE